MDTCSIHLGVNAKGVWNNGVRILDQGFGE